MTRNEIKIRLLERIKKEVPRKSGVYLFKDRHGKIVYIGKSVNLRQRMSSYLLNNKSHEERIHRMICAIRDFQWHETPSELMALLMENELIKKHMPAYNIRQKEFPYYQYLMWTGHEFPTLRMIDHSGRYPHQSLYGPFRDHYFAQNILDILHQVFHIRSCTEAKPANHCINHDIGICLGPCRGDISTEAYAKSVNDTAGFLEGNDEVVVLRLTREMERVSALRQFEKAAQLKEQIAFCKSLCSRQRFLQRFRKETFVIRDNESARMTYIFLRGSPIVYTGHVDEEEIRQRISRSTSVNWTASGDDRLILDRANIVHRWIGRNPDGCEHFFLDIIKSDLFR
jgi:excinuclease ABC subunit C